MHIGELLDRAAVAPRLHAADRRQALQLAGEALARTVPVRSTELAVSLAAREAQGSTGLGHGVAVPHAQVAGLQRARAAFLRLDQPVAWDAVDDQPVDLVFALVSPEGAAVEHLKALARISRTLRDADLRDELRRAASPDALHALLCQETHAATAA